MYEEIVEGMEQETEVKEYDEHVWTSPVNAIKIIQNLKKEIIEIDNTNKEKYENSADDYINKLKKLDEEIRNIIDNSKRKELIFGAFVSLIQYTIFSGTSVNIP